MGLLEPLKEQVHVELAQKLTATDGLLKENISKMCRSRVSQSSSFACYCQLTFKLTDRMLLAWILRSIFGPGTTEVGDTLIPLIIMTLISIFMFSYFIYLLVCNDTSWSS